MKKISKNIAGLAVLVLIGSLSLSARNNGSNTGSFLRADVNGGDLEAVYDVATKKGNGLKCTVTSNVVEATRVGDSYVYLKEKAGNYIPYVYSASPLVKDSNGKFSCGKQSVKKSPFHNNLKASGFGDVRLQYASQFKLLDNDHVEIRFDRPEDGGIDIKMLNNGGLDFARWHNVMQPMKRYEYDRDVEEQQDLWQAFWSGISGIARGIGEL